MARIKAEKTNYNQAENKKAHWISNLHPDYVRSMKYFQLCRDFYNGGIDVLDKAQYLHRNYKESVNHYNARITSGKRFYDNKIKEPVNTLLNLIFQNKNFSGGISEQDSAGILADFLDNADGSGQKINQFMYSAGVNQLVDGVGFISIEPIKPAYTIENPTQISVEDVKRLNLVPRWRLIDRDKILDWMFINGELISVKIEICNLGRADIDGDPNASNKLYLKWKRISDSVCEWQYFNEDGTGRDEPVQLNLPAIPLVPVYYNKIRDFYSDPLVIDAVYTARALYNLDNEVHNYIGMSAMAKWCFPVKSEPERKAVAEMDSSASSDFWTEPADSKGIRSISLDQAPYASANIERDKLVTLIYQNLKQRLINEDVQNSGISKAYDFRITNSEVANIARNLEEAENRAHFLTAAWITGDADRARDLQIKRVYPKEFDVTLINEKFDELDRFKLAGAPETFTKELLRDMIKKNDTYQKLDEAIQDVINAELDEETDESDSHNEGGLLTDSETAQNEVQNQMEQFMNGFNDNGKDINNNSKDERN